MTDAARLAAAEDLIAVGWSLIRQRAIPPGPGPLTTPAAYYAARRQLAYLTMEADPVAYFALDTAIRQAARDLGPELRAAWLVAYGQGRETR